MLRVLVLALATSLALAGGALAQPAVEVWVQCPDLGTARGALGTPDAWAKALTYRYDIGREGDVQSGGGGGAGKATSRGFSITKELDGLSPAAAKAMFDGRAIKAVTLTVTRRYDASPDALEVARIELSDVRIVETTLSSAPAVSGQVLETWRLTFARITYYAVTRDATGAIRLERTAAFELPR